MGITFEEIKKILSEEEAKWDGDNAIGDNAMKGLKILEKYAEDNVLIGAEHDVIFSIGIYEAIESGITQDDVIELGRLNWMIDHETFACFV